MFRWYRSLDTPPCKPPDPVFGAIRPALQRLVSVGACRPIRSPRSSARDEALALRAANVGLVTACATIFFGRRSLSSGGVAAATGMPSPFPPLSAGS
jgi:translocator protein